MFGTRTTPVRAGAFNDFNSKKLMRGLQISRENRLPYVQFVESAVRTH